MVFVGLLGRARSSGMASGSRAVLDARPPVAGLLSFPLILFHGGFHFGGLLTRTLMWLFVFVWVSGILGAALQHFMPRFQTAQLPMETIYEQIDRVRGQLAEEAVNSSRKLVRHWKASFHASERQRAMSASAGTREG